MRRLFGKNKTSALDAPIASVLEQMTEYGPDNPEYKTLLKHLKQLNRMKAEEAQKRFNPDVVLTVVGNLLGILIIVAYEQKHPMVSKALGFVNRTREPHTS